jgi:uncharacterized protein
MSPPALVQLLPRAPRLHPELSWSERLDRLRRELLGLGRVVVAYSGGVDSSLLLRVAHDTLSSGALGVIGRSDSYSARELELALEQARGFGAAVEVVPTGELSDPNFRSNPADRCYYCKDELYRRLGEVAARFGAAAILDGTIVDDLSDHRPGRRAAAERAVRSPLVELGFDKADVRAAAAHLGLASAAKPASPCLASRIPYGTEITRESLERIERAEAALRELGFAELRVRHYGDTARIEVPLADLTRLVAPEIRGRVVAGLKGAGYRWVSVDLEGFRSGSLNRDLAEGEPGGSGSE